MTCSHSTATIIGYSLCSLVQIFRFKAYCEFLPSFCHLKNSSYRASLQTLEKSPRFFQLSYPKADLRTLTQAEIKRVIQRHAWAKNCLIWHPFIDVKTLVLHAIEGAPVSIIIQICKYRNIDKPSIGTLQCDRWSRRDWLRWGSCYNSLYFLSTWPNSHRIWS